MYVPEFFKYGPIVSIPLFSLVAVLLIRSAVNFSPTKNTVSESVLFLHNSHRITIFRLNFLVKAFLDLCFCLYVITRLRLVASSPAAWAWATSALLFGSLAWVLEGKQSLLHRFIVYTSGVLWALGAITVMLSVNSRIFTSLSLPLILVPLAIALGAQFFKKVNIYVQAVCMVPWYAWVILFTLWYL